MPSLHEYFMRDGAQNLTQHQTWPLTVDGVVAGEIIPRLHFDFDANAKYVSVYVPIIKGLDCPEAYVLTKLPEILKWPETVQVAAGFGNEIHDARELVFTGRIYFYSERPVPDEFKQHMLAEATPQGHTLVFRSAEYTAERSKWEKPRAFISHDSRDKADIAEPLAMQLQKFMCPVWYDDFMLKVGDSLRESIEQGLKECPKCILVLTPNFLGNDRWTKREYDTVFTRELIENQKVILPVWHGVSREDVYKYSPILADRVGVQWSKGVEEVARRLIQAIGV